MILSPSLSATSLSRRTFLRGSVGVAVISMLSACGGGGESAVTPDTPRLASVENFRDIAGAGDGYPTADGRRVRRGVVYRSGALTADDADAVALARLSIVALHDLRTVSEAALAPDRVPSGAARETHEIALIDALAAMPTDAAAASQWMIDRQRAMIADRAACIQFGSLLSRLARAAGPQVVHGATGKDRTGWAAALLLSIANVPFDVIIQDYLLTNTVAQSRIAARVAAHAARIGVSTQAVAPFYEAQSATIEAAFDEMQKRFGTLSDYLTSGLSLVQTDIDMLRARLVS